MMQVPPPPPGFQLDTGGPPPPPPGFQMAPPQAQRPAPARREPPQRAPMATSQAAPTGPAPLLTVEEMAAANMASGYDPARAWELAQEDYALQTEGADPGMAPAQPASPLDDVNIHRPENYFPDSAAAINTGPAYSGPGSSEDNPFVLRENDTSREYNDALQSLSRGMYVQTPEGVRRLSGDPYINENADPNDTRVGQAVLREENLADQSRAFAMAAAEQIPFLDEAAKGAAGAISGRGYSDVNQSWNAVEDIDNQVNRGQRIAGGLTGFAGAMALPAGGGFVGRGASAADKTARAALVSGLIGAGHSAGAAEGGFSERARAAALGGALSAATGGVLQGGVNRLARPTADTAQRRLSRMGQELTMGQMAGGGLQRAEDALTSLPFAGDVIRSRQRDTLSSFDTLATNTALNPLAQALESSAGRLGVREADDIISGAYTRALEPVTAFNPADETLTAALAVARSPERLTSDVAASLNSTLDNILSQAPGEIDGQMWKRIDSQLAAAARSAEAGAATRPEMSALQDRLKMARAAWRDALGRVSEDALAGVSAADAAEAQYRLVRKASSDVASAGRGGDASPATLNRAVIGAASDRRAARGESLLQDLTDDAMQVLPRTVPDSGTPLRSLMTGAGIGGGGAALGVDPAALTLAALLTGGVSAAYSKPAQRLANQLYRASDTAGSTRDVAGLAEALRRAPIGVSVLQPDAPRSRQEQRRASR